MSSIYFVLKKSNTWTCWRSVFHISTRTECTCMYINTTLCYMRLFFLFCQIVFRFVGLFVVVAVLFLFGGTTLCAGDHVKSNDIFHIILRNRSLKSNPNSASTNTVCIKTLVIAKQIFLGQCIQQGHLILQNDDRRNCHVDTTQNNY